MAYVPKTAVTSMSRPRPRMRDTIVADATTLMFLKLLDTRRVCIAPTHPGKPVAGAPGCYCIDSRSVLPSTEMSDTRFHAVAISSGIGWAASTFFRT